MRSEQRELQPSATTEDRFLGVMFGDRFRPDPERTLEAKDPLKKLKQAVLFAQAQLELFQGMYAGLDIKQRIAYHMYLEVLGGNGTVDAIGVEIGMSPEDTQKIIDEAGEKVQANNLSQKPSSDRK